MDMWLDLRRIVYVLSDALDLVGVDDVAHGKRVAFMAVRTAELMGIPSEACEDLLYAGLFHDCGVSSTREHRDLAGGLDWDGEQAHCERGAALISGFRPLAHLSQVIRWHHTHSLILETMDLPVLVKVLANLVYLADRVDVLAVNSIGDVLMARNRIQQVVAENSGTRFRADAVEAILEASSHEDFWLTMEPRALPYWLETKARRPAPARMSMDDLEDLGVILARIVDAKSPFTAQHSQRVAAVARLLGKAAGLPPERTRRVGVAALLHDIGKLRVPDQILDKPAALDEGERCVMVRHAFDTYQILSRIDGFEEIACWAAFHHESVGGGGYPFGHDGRQLSVESRIVAVSDVFQALRQDRPYRPGMHIDKTMDTVNRMAIDRKLDSDVVGLLHENLGDCDAAAKGAA